jgi:uncharacterized RDD family membrane protein YckC
MREIPTPEGVPLRFELALAGDRAGAFIVDALVLVLVETGVFVALSLLSSIDEHAALAAMFISFFVARNCYFAGLEILWRGRTVGKRILGLQVIDRSGRALRVEAIFARNLTREIEVFLPLMVALGGGAIWPGMPPWGRIITLLWALFFVLFPLLNRDRLRLGDLLAGTLVVKSPRPVLLPDLSAAGAKAAAAPAAELRFAREQLEAYGIYELQVLERILRQDRTPTETVRAVAERIAGKIGWKGAMDDPRAFLADFYRAQRAHLEGRLMLGERREDKAAAAERRPGRSGTPPRR